MSFFFNRYPYTDFHELNLDWIISKIKEIKDSVIAAAASEESAADSAEAAASSASAAADSAEAAAGSAEAAADSAEEVAENLSALISAEGIINDVIQVVGTLPAGPQSLEYYNNHFILVHTANNGVIYVVDPSTLELEHQFNNMSVGHANCCVVIDGILYVGDYDNWKIHRFDLSDISNITALSDIVCQYPTSGRPNQMFLTKQTSSADSRSTLFATFKCGHNSSHYFVYQVFDDHYYSDYSTNTNINKAYLVKMYTAQNHTGSWGQDTSPIWGYSSTEPVIPCVQAVNSNENNGNIKSINFVNPLSNNEYNQLKLTNIGEPEGICYNATGDTLYFTSGYTLYKIPNIKNYIDVVNSQPTFATPSMTQAQAKAISFDWTNKKALICRPWGLSYGSTKRSDGTSYDPGIDVDFESNKIIIQVAHLTYDGKYGFVKLQLSSSNNNTGSPVMNMAGAGYIWDSATGAVTTYANIDTLITAMGTETVLGSCKTDIDKLASAHSIPISFVF